MNCVTLFRVFAEIVGLQDHTSWNVIPPPHFNFL